MITRWIVRHPICRDVVALPEQMGRNHPRPAIGVVLMSTSAVIVAIKAQLLRRVEL